MTSSLEKLALYITEADEIITCKHCNCMEGLKLLTRKGVFPYESVDSWEKIDEEHLSSKTDFYSKLNNENISSRIMCTP